MWLASLQQSILHVTSAKDYFKQDLTEVDPAAANGIFVLIEQSIINPRTHGLWCI
jgi:hypothetical protein